MWYFVIFFKLNFRERKGRREENRKGERKNRGGAGGERKKEKSIATHTHPDQGPFSVRLKTKNAPKSNFTRTQSAWAGAIIMTVNFRTFYHPTMKLYAH